MTKTFLILILIFVLVVYVSIKYRKQIAFAIGLYRMLRGHRAAVQNHVPEVRQTNLVQCAACGTWTPENGAKRFPQNLFYCSDACLSVRNHA